jgi:hypothetical protein
MPREPKLLIDAALERRDRAELIALIRQMLARAPELEALLDLPLPTIGRHMKPADPALIRRQALEAFRESGDSWRAVAMAAVNLEPLLQIGDAYAQIEDWASAAGTYQMIAQTVLDQYGQLHDDEGDLHPVVDRCVEGLAECLRAADDPAQREGLLRALFDIYRWDVDYGGIDMGVAAPGIIEEQATPDERRLVAGWVRDAMQAANTSHTGWRRENFGRFLLRLAGDNAGDETFLEICRAAGLQREMVARLLARKRDDEALAEAARTSDAQLLDIANLLVALGPDGAAERLVREHTSAPGWQSRHLTWLRDRAKERGDSAEALALSERIFWLQPTLAGYDELRAVGQKQRDWPQLRAELRERLDKASQHPLLTEIALREGDVTSALANLAKVKQAFASSSEPLLIKVARAAEQSHPHEATRLYLAAAEQQIRAQGRENYRVAAGHLTRVRSILLHLDEEGQWRAIIAGLREQNRRLRALREELDRAGL